MCNKSKHKARSRRSHRQDNSARSNGLYYMATVVNRKRSIRHQRKGDG